MDDLFPDAVREYVFTGDELVLEAERELAMRITVYGRRVKEGKMTRAAADRQIALQKAILAIVQKHGGAKWTVSGTAIR